MKKYFEKPLECLLILLFAITIVSVGLQVFFRYLLNSLLTWSEELARLAFMWMLFLGLCLAEKDNIHVAVDFFMDRLPARIQKPFRVAVELFSIAVLWAVCYFSIDFINMQRFMRSVALDVSMLYFTLSVPIGCLFYSIYKFFTIARIIGADGCRRTPEADDASASE